MAEEYINELLVNIPDGPFILCGGSMGGSIAFEAARQLKAKGKQVEHLIMFDTFGPDINIKVESKKRKRTLQSLKDSVYYRVMSKVNGFIGKIYSSLNRPIPHKVRYFNIEMNNYQAIWKYKPESYTGDIVLFRAPIANSGWYSDPHMGWRRVIKGDIFSYYLESGHNDFVEHENLPKLFNKIIKDD